MNTQDAIDKLREDILTYHPDAKPNSLRQFESVSKRYLDSTNGSRDHVGEFISQFPALSSRRFARYIIKRLFEANGWPWTFPMRRIRSEQRPFQPVLSHDDISQIIRYRELLSPREIAYLALSSTYGFRRAEMASMSKDNFNNGKVQVQTLKFGQLRVHGIPKEIKPYLKDIKPLDPSVLSKMYNHICNRVGVDNPKGAGWHCIRRCVISELLKDCSPVAVSSFMGWKKPQFMENPFVASVMPTYMHLSPSDMEEEVFANHPFLRQW